MFSTELTNSKLNSSGRQLSMLSKGVLGLAVCAMIGQTIVSSTASGTTTASGPSMRWAQDANSQTTAQPIAQPVGSQSADSAGSSLKDSALAAFQGSDFSKAAELLEELRINQFVDYSSINGYYLEGKALIQLKRFADAVVFLERWELSLPSSVTSLEPSDVTLVESLQQQLVDAYFLRANACYQLGLNSNEERAQWFEKSLAVANRLALAKVLAGTEYAQHANLIRAKVLMQSELADIKPQTLELLRAKFANIAETSSGELQQESAYYQAYCDQLLGKLGAAREVFSDLRTILEETPNHWMLPAVLVRLGENHMAVAVDSITTQQEAATEFGSALEVYEGLQRDFPNHQPAYVAFNSGSAHQALGQNSQAIQQFRSLQQMTSASDNLRWMAGFNEVKCDIQLGEVQQATLLIKDLLKNLSFATPSQQAPAIELAMKLANDAQDYSSVSQLNEAFSDLLQRDTAIRQNADYYVAVAQAHSMDPVQRQAGLDALDKLAISGAPSAFAAKLSAAQIRFAEIDRVVVGRPSFDEQQQKNFDQDLRACIGNCLTLLDSSELDVSKFPVNPKVLTDAQKQTLMERSEIESWLANCYFQAGQFEKAEAIYRQLLQQDFAPSQTRTAWVLGQNRTLLALEQHLAATELLKRFINDQSLDLTDQLAIRNQLADTYQSNQQYDEAAAEYEYIYKHGGNDKRTHQAIVDALFCYNSSRQFNRAIRLADDVAVDLDGQTLAIVMSSRGIAQYNLNQFDGAIQDLNRAIEWLSTMPAGESRERDLHDPYLFRSMALFKKKDPKAAEALQDFITRYPTSQTLDQVQKSLAQLGVTPIMPEAVAKSDGASSSESKETSSKSSAAFEAGLAAARTLQQSEKWTEAVASLESLIENSNLNESGLDQAYFELGYSQRKLESVDDAMQTFESLLATYPDSRYVHESQYYLGDLNQKKKQFVEAAKYFAAASESNIPDVKVKSHYLRGWMLSLTLKYTAAATEFEKVVADFPANPLAKDALLQKARNQFLADEFENAYATFAQVFDQRKLSSDWKDSREELATRVMAGKAALAGEHYAEAKAWLSMEELLSNTEVKPTEEESKQILYELALAHRGLNEDAAAEAIFLELAKSPTVYGAQSLDALALSAKDAGENSRAIVRYKNLANGAYGSSPSLIVLQLQANAMLQVGLLNTQLAREATTLNERNANLAEARSWLTRAQEQTVNAEISQQAQKAMQLLSF